MARTPIFSPAEDRIILDLTGRPAVVVNAVLTEMGFTARSAASLSNRRWYIRNRPGDAQTRRDSPVMRLEQRRLELVSRIEVLRSQIDDTSDELTVIREQLYSEIQKASLPAV